MRTDPQAPKRQAGISFLLIDMDTPGITLRPIKTDRRRLEVNEVFFEDVRVPADQLVGEENQGWTYAKFLLGNERTGIAQVGRTKVRLAEVKQHAAQTGVLDDPLFAARLAEAENELLALELTQMPGGLGLRRAASPTRRRRCSSCAAASCSRSPPNCWSRSPDRMRCRSTATASRHRRGRRPARRATSTTARPRSTAAATKCSATSSRPPFSDCEAVMDFQLSEEQALLRDTTRDLLSRSYDPESRNKVIDTDLGWSRDVWNQLAEIGILGLGFEQDEAGQIEIMVVMTEIGRRLAPEPVLHAALAPGALIAELGTAAQRELLDEVAAGQRLLAFAHLEPGNRRPSADDHDSCCAAR